MPVSRSDQKRTPMKLLWMKGQNAERAAADHAIVGRLMRALQARVSTASEKSKSVFN